APGYSSKKNNDAFSATTKNAAAFSITEQGAGEWIKDVNDDGNFYALHATAPIGSMITVKNQMNNKIISAKVIGKLPPAAADEHIIIKLSASAAKALNILDNKFRVDLSYKAAR